MQRFRPVHFWGLVIVFFLSGCAAKSHTARHRSSGGTQTADAETTSDEPTEDVVLFEEELEAQQKGEAPTYDIPVDRNAKVEQWLAYFQGRGRKWFHVWLERSGRYVPAMRKILKDHDLPEDLVYLAMIESGFSSKAYSRARAVGIWQFMKATGRLYGLKINFWVDERRDPEKSSIAAARHLKDLYDQFQSWKLAAAAYNAGSGKVSRAIKKYKTEDFWELTKGHYMRPETRHYVPKMIAAALIAKEPEKYGFKDIQYQDALAYDKVILNSPVNLAVLAQKSGVDLEVLMVINPELNHPVTPPDARQYELRVPPGASENFLEAFNSLSADEKFKYSSHTLRKGDTLAKLASIYSIPASEIMKLNNLKSAKSLRTGITVLIPVGVGEKLVGIGERASKSEERRPAKRRRASRKEAVDSVYASGYTSKARSPVQVTSRAEGSAEDFGDVDQSSKKKVHIVQRGESLWAIANHYGVSVVEIKNANRLRHSKIWPGKRLRIPES